MPRVARKKINTPFIHVMVQGVNKEYVFDNPKNLNYYLKSIKSESHYKEFDLLAYCMMNNHAHFLFYVKDIECFGQFMKSVNQNFANFYNKSEDRVGVVFRNRYQLEPIYEMSHLVNCIKYIHNNPVKAGIATCCEAYPYSSYQDYLRGQGCAKCEILKEVFGENVNYLKAIDEAYDRVFMDLDSTKIGHEYFEDGVRSFIAEYNHSLIEIFSVRAVLQKLIVYLNQECKLKQKDIINWLSVSKAILDENYKVKL